MLIQPLMQVTTGVIILLALLVVAFFVLILIGMLSIPIRTEAWL